MSAMLFDLEGTLVITSLYQRSQEALELERQEIKKNIIGLGVPEVVLPGLMPPPSMLNRALDWLEANKNREEVTRFVEKLEAYMKIGEMKSAWKARLFPDTIEVLSKLESMGFDLGVVTNASRGAAEYMMRNLGLTRFFSVVVTRSDSPRPKPDPSMIFEAVNRMESQAEWLVGDSAHDAEAARRAGVKSIIVGRDGKTPEFDYDFFVDSLLEVPLLAYRI